MTGEEDNDWASASFSVLIRGCTAGLGTSAGKRADGCCMSPHKLAAHSADMPLTPTAVTLWLQEKGGGRESLAAPTAHSAKTDTSGSLASILQFLKVQCWETFPR